MAPRPPNYSHERSQRERAQRAKADEKAQKQAEKTARRKALNEESSTQPNETDRTEKS
ncbi:MAG: hypothetical protein ACXWLK_05640 [Rhizomicrobium sp.]